MQSGSLNVQSVCVCARDCVIKNLEHSIIPADLISDHGKFPSPFKYILSHSLIELCYQSSADTWANNYTETAAQWTNTKTSNHMNNTPRRALCYVKIQNYNDHAVSACLLQRLDHILFCLRVQNINSYCNIWNVTQNKSRTACGKHSSSRWWQKAVRMCGTRANIHNFA